MFVFTPLYIQIEDEDDTFIKEVFSGCVRHNGILKVVTEGFFASDGKRILRSSEAELCGELFHYDL